MNKYTATLLTILGISSMVWGCQLSDRKIAQTPTLNPAQSSTPTISPTTVRFLIRQGKESAVGVESEATQKGVSLYPLGISALNQNIAFVYGLSNVGSILLRTEDWGKNWQEVIDSDPRSRVPYVAFANPQIGWAILEDFWGEGSGPWPALYQTRDAGLTWKKLSDLPLASHAWELNNMRFFDSRRGEIDIYNITCDLSDRPCLLSFTTSDGGHTWKVTNRVTFKDSAVGEAYQHNHSLINFERSRGFDDSVWQLVDNFQTENVTVLRTRVHTGKPPVTVSAIPRKWCYKQGQILPCKTE
jgi:hypothetical protein